MSNWTTFVISVPELDYGILPGLSLLGAGERTEIGCYSLIKDSNWSIHIRIAIIHICAEVLR